MKSSLLLLLFDAVSFCIMATFYGAAIGSGYLVYVELAEHIMLPLAAIASLVTGVLALILAVGVARLCLPRISPGRHDLFKGKVFFSWAFHSILRRTLFAPGLKTVLFQFYTLRFLALRALGARVAFGANMSSDVDILDPWLLSVETGATIGTRCLVAGHFIDRGQLVLGEVVIGEGTLLAAHVMVAPDVKIGKQCRVLVGVRLGVNVRIGDDVTVGGASNISNDTTIASNARLGSATFAHPGANIEGVTEANTIVHAP